ncbi:MAG TPA: VOC family protein [Acidimicrobiia bacterium]|nr:VOC family protein [Acidimicrobiia bacterium]
MMRLSAKGFQQESGADGWRALDATAHAWFEAPSHSAGASLVERVAGSVEGSTPPDIDLRPTGVRVRLAGIGEAEVRQAAAISEAARGLGLTPDPSTLQVAGLAIDAVDPAALMPFWRTVLAYRQDDTAHLTDPLRRDPAIVFHQDDGTRPLRNRLHVDVGRPPERVAAALAELRHSPSGPYGLMVSDDDGNEVDLVPGGPMSDASESDDWRAPFAAMVFYPTPAAGRATALVTAVARLADDAGIPLLIDVRSDGVVIDSGKDLWEGEDGPLPAFTDLAARIQSAARDLGLTADPSRPRFVQLGLDVADLSAVRGFWASALGYELDPRQDVVDIYDPRRLSPVLIFQRIDSTDEDRRRQRDRIRLVLHVPDDHLEQRIDIGIEAGGTVVRTSPGLTRLSDPEGNELDLITPGD